MKIPNALMLIGGFGSWLLFVVAISVSSFGLLENMFGQAHYENLLIYAAMIVSVIGAVIFILYLIQHRLFSLAIIGGLLSFCFIATVFALFVLKAVRYA
jgi:hypothetical protein